MMQKAAPGVDKDDAEVGPEKAEVKADVEAKARLCLLTYFTYFTLLTLLYLLYFTYLLTYFTLLYWIEADANPGLRSLKKKEMRTAED